MKYFECINNTTYTKTCTTTQMHIIKGYWYGKKRHTIKKKRLKQRINKCTSLMVIDNVFFIVSESRTDIRVLESIKTVRKLI